MSASNVSSAPVAAYHATSKTSGLSPTTITRRPVGDTDVDIEIIFTGLCHSDVHAVRGEWGNTIYPVVPGHEIVGKVVGVGKNVTKFKIGELVGVGCLVDSCSSCDACKDAEEQFCPQYTLTYNSKSDKEPQGVTQGGYSQRIVVRDAFVVKISHKEEQLAAVAPLLCAGITVYSPLRHWKAGKGKNVGVVGIGGLGHMALKLSHAMGAFTVAFTTSKDKVEQAKKWGADDVVISKDAEEMKKYINTFDLILDTVSSSHNLDVYTALLRRNGTLCLLGVPEHPHPAPSVIPLIFSRKSIAGSPVGSIRETQEMLDFCAKQGIVSDIELIQAKQLNEAYDRLVKGDVKGRFVLDNKTLLA